MSTLFKKVTECEYKEFKGYLRYIKQKIKEQKVQDITSIEALINDTTEGKGKTVMHFAAAKGDAKVFRVLLKNGGSLQKRDDEDNTPFFTAVTHGHMDIIKHVVEKKLVDINETRNGNVTALHLAVSYGNLDLIKYLVGQGADINRVSEYGNPLTWAAVNKTKQQIEIVEYLIGLGVSLNGNAESCIPAPLILAIDQNNQDLFDVLIKNNADVNVKDDQKYSALHVCAERGTLKMLHALLEKGADPNYEREGKTPLYHAFENQRFDAIGVLRQHTQQ